MPKSKNETTTPEIYDEFEVSELLIALGVHPECKGYDYTIMAMNLIKQDRTYVNTVTRRLYPEIAKKKGITPTNVERCIRTEMRRVMRCENSQLAKQVFGEKLDSLTNSRFLACLYEYFRIQKRIILD